jgi:WD40 repeat protein
LIASPDGQLLVASNIPIARTSLIDPYSLRTSAVLSTPRTLGGHLPLLRFSSDGRFLAAPTAKGRVLIWDTALPYLAYDLAAHTELWETAELGVRGCTRRLPAWADGFTDQARKSGGNPQDME